MYRKTPLRLIPAWKLLSFRLTTISSPYIPSNMHYECMQSNAKGQTFATVHLRTSDYKCKYFYITSMGCCSCNYRVSCILLSNIEFTSIHVHTAIIHSFMHHDDCTSIGPCSRAQYCYPIEGLNPGPGVR